MAKNKGSNAIDAHVGSRVRTRRMILGMSQATLGERLGVTLFDAPTIPPAQQ
jgi:transcriptional regulator with XRE-family HTH domain